MDEGIGFLVIPIILVLAVVVCAVVAMVVFGFAVLCVAGVWVVSRRNGRSRRLAREAGPDDVW